MRLGTVLVLEEEDVNDLNDPIHNIKGSSKIVHQADIIIYKDQVLMNRFGKCGTLGLEPWGHANTEKPRKI